MMNLTDFDFDVLRVLNGEDVPGMRWGAAMSVSVEYLARVGAITRGPNYQITDKGRAKLEENRAKSVKA